VAEEVLLEHQTRGVAAVPAGSSCKLSSRYLRAHSIQSQYRELALQLQLVGIAGLALPVPRSRKVVLLVLMPLVALALQEVRAPRLAGSEILFVPVVRVQRVLLALQTEVVVEVAQVLMQMVLVLPVLPAGQVVLPVVEAAATQRRPAARVRHMVEGAAAHSQTMPLFARAVRVQQAMQQ
jgi:hypothetical protein